MIFIRFEFTQTTQVCVHLFKSFIREKSTLKEKVHFSKENELKVIQVELHSLFLQIYFKLWNCVWNQQCYF